MATKNDGRIRVWDLPVRLFHWLLVILMITSYFSGRAGGDWMTLHFWSGYAILTLLLFRIAWGFVGSTTARFSDFVKGRRRPSGTSPTGRRRPAARGRAQPARRRHGGGADLRGAGAGRGGLFAADTDMGTVNGPLANLIADKWVDRLTAFHKFWVNVLLVWSRCTCWPRSSIWCGSART
jgi:hypothetical protein